ncbi:hypothetical protein DPMN_181599 [Dreissena polymorpha]|uniref:Uncharacterized protein n=1 Tax=Dreissena polymorpha TaxID=45954 RepID=A0A9D4DEE3_DREPO|nr:hypothetical protein DPMN_181599 [Dreissena polymorpha]
MLRRALLEPERYNSCRRMAENGYNDCSANIAVEYLNQSTLIKGRSKIAVADNGCSSKIDRKEENACRRMAYFESEEENDCKLDVGEYLSKDNGCRRMAEENSCLEDNGCRRRMAENGCRRMAEENGCRALESEEENGYLVLQSEYLNQRLKNGCRRMAENGLLESEEENGCRRRMAEENGCLVLESEYLNQKKEENGLLKPELTLSKVSVMRPYVLTKYHDDLAVNVAFRFLICKYVFGTNVLIKFHQNLTINLSRDIIGNYVVTKFYKVRTINVSSLSVHKANVDDAHRIAHN